MTKETKKIGMINRPEEKLGKYGANTVSIPKLSISNVGYDKSAYWKGHYSKIVQDLRETINSQAEIIAELTLTKSKIVKQLDELREILDGLKQSIGLDDSGIDDQAPEKVRNSYGGTGWAMSSSGDIRIDDDEVKIQRAIRKSDADDTFSPDGEETMIKKDNNDDA